MTAYRFVRGGFIAAVPGMEDLVTTLVRRFFGQRIPISPGLILAMAAATLGAALLGAYVLVLLVGP